MMKKVSTRELRYLIGQRRGIEIQNKGGDTFLICPLDDSRQTLLVRMVRGIAGDEIDEARIAPADLFDWIQAREDW